MKLAYLLIKQNRYDEALAHARDALRVNPEQHRAHYALGLIMQKQGNIEQATQHFSAALRLEPGYTAAEENLPQIPVEHEKVGQDAGAGPEVRVPYPASSGP